MEKIYFFKPKKSNVSPEYFDNPNSSLHVYTKNVDLPRFCEKWRIELIGRNKSNIVFFLEDRVDNYDHQSEIILDKGKKHFLVEKGKAFILPLEYFVI